MTIRDLVPLIDARVLRGGDRLDTPVVSACCSDLMSDVLAFVNEKTVLLTGLCNLHVVRTAEILDLKCLIFARGKIPGQEVLDRAEQLHLVVLSTDKTMFTAAGLLYQGGVRGARMQWDGGGEAQVS
ncbi:MAG: DRTGG domain-containing protein [Christensenellales bacterium]